MDLAKGFFILFLLIGVIMLVVYFATNSELQRSCKNQTIYKYIPRTLAEEQTSPYFVSQIFSAMFEQGSVWIDSIGEYPDRKREVLNRYFMSQF
jgi:hypothetical protein